MAEEAVKGKIMWRRIRRRREGSIAQRFIVTDSII
jgi:hypothetical protein